jgi:hypothetical protein
VLIASNGGNAKHPAWWLNLRAQPEASVQIGRGAGYFIERSGKTRQTRRLVAQLSSLGYAVRLDPVVAT